MKSLAAIISIALALCFVTCIHAQVPFWGVLPSALPGAPAWTSSPTADPGLNWSVGHYDTSNQQYLVLSDMPERIEHGGEVGEKLWEYYVQGRGVVDVHLFALHVNDTTPHKSIHFSVVLENLTPTSNTLTVDGKYIGGPVNGGPAYNTLAQQMAYAVQRAPDYTITRSNPADTLFNPINFSTGSNRLSSANPSTVLHPVMLVRHGQNIVVEYIFRIRASVGPIRCRIATVWHENNEDADFIAQGDSGSPLVLAPPSPKPHQRGAWLSSNYCLNNQSDPFNATGRAGTFARLRFSTHSGGTARRFSREVVPYAGDISFRPVQSDHNIGFYGVWIQVDIFAINTDTVPRNFDLHVGLDNVTPSVPVPNPVLQGAAASDTNHPSAFALNYAHSPASATVPIRSVTINPTNTPTKCATVYLYIGSNSSLPCAIILARR